ncbi:hypothetical protein Lal_00001391 [Lupinus albus]|nr:hypothetical protein Lal_00001391 [Lupinus albus]
MNYNNVKVDFKAPGTYECLFSEYYKWIKGKEGLNYSHVQSADIMLKKAEASPSIPQNHKVKAPLSNCSSRKGKEAITTPTTTTVYKRRRTSSTSSFLGPRHYTSRRLQTRSSTSFPTLSEHGDLGVDAMHATASVAETVHNVCNNVADETVTKPLVSSTDPLVGIPDNFASWTSRDDAKLASSFVSVHPDIVFPNSSYAQCFLEPAYKTFMFRDSSSTHDLVSENRALLVEKLKGMKLFGFSGSWLENLLEKLDGPNSLHAPVDISLLNQTEESYATQRVSLIARIYELSSSLKASNNKLIEVEEKLKDIAAEKKIYEEACDELGSFFSF